MRMWMVNPVYMCKDHLLGEHREIHMCVGYLKNRNHLKHYAYHGLIEVNSLQSRHEILVKEMERRGYNHNTPLIITEDISKHLDRQEVEICINRNYSLNLLLGRCSKCRYLYLQHHNKTQLFGKVEQLIYAQPNVNDVSDMPKRYQIANAMDIITQVIHEDNEILYDIQ